MESFEEREFAMLNIWISVLLFTAALITLLIAIFSINKKDVPGATAFSFLCFASTIYSFGYAMELLNSNLDVILRWNFLQVIGSEFLPVFWIIVAIQYCGREKLLTPFVKSLLFGIPFFIIFMRYTNSFHHLFYQKTYMVSNGFFPVIAIEKGPLFLFNSVFVTFSIIFSNILYLRLLVQSKGKFRNQATIMFLASLLPFISYLLLIVNKSPYGIDFTPISTTLSYILLLFGLFKLQFLNLVPLAHHIVFEGMNDPIIVFDKNYFILDYNLAATEVFHELNRQSIGKKVDMVLGNRSQFLQIISEGKETQYELIKENQSMFFNVKISILNGKLNHLVGYIVEMNNNTLQIETMNRLQLIASTDSLTGIFNRRYFLELSEIELAKAKKNCTPATLIMFDLDRFKNINDYFGHQAGDAVLKQVAIVSKASIRSQDILGRFGGEEFIIFLPETQLEKAVEIGERIRGNIEKLNIITGSNNIHITSSFGVASMIEICEETMDSLIKLADDALYLAKVNGRNCVKTYVPK